MLFKKQYEAHLIASQQDYATDPEFRAAYIAQDKSFDILCRQYEASKAQIASDTKQQYGALAMACSGNDEGQRFLGLYPRDGIRVWHEMVHWFQYGGSVETILGELESNLQTDYTDRYPGGILAYVNMIANTYAKQRQVITDNPTCGTFNPTDVMKMRHIRAKLQGTSYSLGIHQDFRACLKENASFDTFLNRIRATVEYVEQGHLSVAKRQARTAQTDMIIESPEAELRSVIARITQTNPMYLPSTLLQLMREIDPELTAKFLQARNKYMKNKQNKSSNNNTVREESATRPTANDSKDIPRQYSDQRNVNFTDTGDYADTVSHENAPEDDDDDNESLVSMVREHYAMLMRLHPGTNTDDGSTRRINNHVTIRGDYQRAVRAALALSADGKHSMVSDGGADTWILGNGWRILAKTRRSTNVVGFDSNYAKKRNLPIVVGCAVTTDIKGRDILLVVFEGVMRIR
jgi:hypothetical protein